MRNVGEFLASASASRVKKGPYFRAPTNSLLEKGPSRMSTKLGKLLGTLLLSGSLAVAVSMGGCSSSTNTAKDGGAGSGGHGGGGSGGSTAGSGGSTAGSGGSTAGSGGSTAGSGGTDAGT